MHRPAARVAGMGTTVFSEFSALAAKHSAVNLGQGFPDFDGPDSIKAAVNTALQGGLNQYAITHGAVPLRHAIARQANHFYGLAYDQETEITVTSGATEAIFDAVMAFVNPGEEVVLFEPFYDSYLASVQMAGATPRFVRMQPPDENHATWWYGRDALAAAIGEKTRMVIVNTPHNPTGKVFDAGELEDLAKLCEGRDIVVLSDEVYEHILYDDARHLPLAAVRGLHDRTLTVSSLGKTFSVTGWKIGWVMAPRPLTQALRSVHQFVTFATASPLQAAAAEALLLPDSYFDGLRRDYAARRDHLVAGLRQVGLSTWAPQGSYFAISKVPDDALDDRTFCRDLIAVAGVAAIPLSPFYEPGGAPPPKLIRFAFCKRHETLDGALERLRGWAARK